MQRLNIKESAREVSRDPKTVREWIERGFLVRGEDGLIDKGELLECAATRDQWRVQTGAQAAALQHHGVEAEEARAARLQAKAEAEMRKREEGPALTRVHLPEDYEGAWLLADPAGDALTTLQRTCEGLKGKRWGKRALVIYDQAMPILKDLRALGLDAEHAIEDVIAEFEQDIELVRAQTGKRAKAVVPGSFKGSDGLASAWRRFRHLIDLELLCDGDRKEDALKLVCRNTARTIEQELIIHTLDDADQPIPGAFEGVIDTADRIRALV
jgi:hypothetical protein